METPGLSWTGRVVSRTMIEVFLCRILDRGDEVKSLDGRTTGYK